MRRLLTLAALAASFATTATANDDLTLFSAEDVFELEWADAPQVSPDGQQAVYLRRFNDIMTDRTKSHIWLVNLDGTAHEPLLADSDSYRSPRWSPQGDRIA